MIGTMIDDANTALALRDAVLRSSIEEMRYRHELKYGRVATHDVDIEIHGRTLEQQFKAWRELL